ncbi:hypothetical protein [Streptomyces sp. NPDC001292]|uniref:hypothetical protein n=1 Tax=Streptomyces sp. NPDC001292 TaxID=3364558 RepID=UPI0036A6A3F5
MSDLGPLLVIAPALTAWLEGPWVTSGIGALAVMAQGFAGWRHCLPLSRNVLVEVVALAVLSTVVVAFCVVRDRNRRQPARVRSVAPLCGLQARAPQELFTGLWSRLSHADD